MGLLNTVQPAADPRARRRAGDPRRRRRHRVRRGAGDGARLRRACCARARSRRAEDPVTMARAIRLGVEAGRLARRAPAASRAASYAAGLDARGGRRRVRSAVRTRRRAPRRAGSGAWSGRDRAAFAPLCAPDVHYEDPLCRRAARRPRRRSPTTPRGCGTAFPDARLEPHGRAARRRALRRRAPCSCIGTHTRRLGALAATGRPLVVHAVVYCELDRAGAAAGGCARSSTSTTRPRAARRRCPSPGTLGERALLLLRGFGLARRRTLDVDRRHVRVDRAHVGDRRRPW